jgi:hypothetical protein
MEKSEWVKRYKKDIMNKAAMPEHLAEEMAENAFEEFKEDSPEDSVDEELSYWED